MWKTSEPEQARAAQRFVWIAGLHRAGYAESARERQPVNASELAVVTNCWRPPSQRLSR